MSPIRSGDNASEAGAFRRSIGLLGPYGTGNLGDAAIQEAAIHHFQKRFPRIRICGISLNPADTAQRHGIESFPMQRACLSANPPKVQEEGPGLLLHRLADTVRSLPVVRSVLGRILDVIEEISFQLRMVRLLRGMDLLAISGGGQLDDFWGGAFGIPFSHLKWCVLAKLSGTRVAFASVGSDCIRSTISKSFIKYALRMADHRSFRDENTMRIVEDLGVKSGNAVYPDLAYSFPVSPFLDRVSPENGKRRVVGISPIAATSWTVQDDPAYKVYLKELIDLTEWLIRNDFQVLFFPSQVKMDTPVIGQVRAELERRGVNGEAGQILQPPVLTVEDLLSTLASADVVLASRMHGVLLSCLMRKPVLAVSPARKVDTVMADMGLSEYCIPIASMRSDTAIRLLRSLLAEKEAVAARIDREATVFAERLNEQYLRLFEFVESSSVRRKKVGHAPEA